MTKVLVIGATGTIGNAVRQTLLNETDAELTLFSHSADRLKIDANRETAISGDAGKLADVEAAVKNQDFVFAALSGNLPKFAQTIVKAMDNQNVKRLAFISSMGIYGEVPPALGGKLGVVSPVLRPYRAAADVIEQSDLDYTVIRPGWFTGGPVDYQVTHKGENFAGHDVSVSSIADCVKQMVENPTLYDHESIGLNTPSY